MSVTYTSTPDPLLQLQVWMSEAQSPWHLLLYVPAPFNCLNCVNSCALYTLC